MEIISKAKFHQLLRQASLPQHGGFELTPLCNLDCRMCYMHLLKSQLPQPMLSEEQWLTLVQGAIKAGMMSALLTGGEALTHPGFRKIYMTLAENGISTVVKSNGVLVNQENIDFLKKNPPNRLDISLYGCNRESYMAITGHDVFDTVAANIRNAIDAGLNVRLSITPNKLMLPWIEGIMDFAKSLHTSEISANVLLVNPREETGRSKESYDLSMDEIYAIIHRWPEIYARTLNLCHKKPRTFCERGLRCGANGSDFCINWDGTMKPCPDFPAESISAHPLKEGFDAAWKKLCDLGKEYEVPVKCRTCSINTKCHYCPVEHGPYGVKHACDEEVCRFWHMIYEPQPEK